MPVRDLCHKVNNIFVGLFDPDRYVYCIIKVIVNSGLTWPVNRHTENEAGSCEFLRAGGVELHLLFIRLPIGVGVRRPVVKVSPG